MKITDIVRTSENFQTSVNIDFDLGNVLKIKNFIPTQESLKLLEEILLSLNSNSKRSRILIGAYGKGKSYIILVLLSILSSAVGDKTCFNALLKKLHAYNPELEEYAREYIHSNKKLLPIVINGSSTSLSQSFMQALYTTLKRKEFEKLMPETHFGAAIKMIDLWQKNYPDTYKVFNEKASVNAEAFKNALKNFDGERFEEFETLYPELTSGSSFNPFSGFDVVDLYSKVCDKLPEYGYSGMFVVYDEFGKYLESSITKATVKDVKLLQDFAEKADRSGKNQLHLLLICHKEIENYIDTLPKQKVDGWKGVSERFGHVHLYNHYSESYELISQAIVKENHNWEKIQSDSKIRNQISELEGKWKENRVYSNEKNLVHNIVYGCWPLHPVTSYVLPRLSEKVAQNERTLFTFLSGLGPQTLSSLIKNKNAVQSGKLFLLSPDVLYDYFAQSMRNEPYTSDIKKWFILSSTLLQKCDSSPQLLLEAKIIKTLTLIYALNQFERLQPSSDIIFDIYRDCGYSFDDINRSLLNLTKNLGLIYERASSNRFLQLKETSGINLPGVIADIISKRKTLVSDSEILNEINTEKYLYPVGYNTEYAVTRFFEVRFIESEEYSLSENADGTFFALLDSDVKKADVKEKSLEWKNAMFAIPKKSESVHDMLRKYDAVCCLEEQTPDDKVLLSEYEIMKDDLFDGIKLFIHSYIQPERNECTYIANGKIVKNYRKSDLTNILTEQMKLVYSCTPPINNEMLNKNKLTGQAYNSRIKLMDGILKSNEVDLELRGTGQEFSFMRSCLTVPKILAENASSKQFNLESCDKKFRMMLNTFESFVESAKKKPVSFTELLEKLTGPENHIGLRRGVIPVYMAVVFSKYSKNLLLRSETGEIPLNSENLSLITEKPNGYTLSVLEWNDEKEKYEKRLESIFKDYILEGERQKVGYEYLFNAIVRWYRALPHYTKQTKENVTEEEGRFINIFKTFASGVQDSLFIKIPKVFAQKQASLETAEKVRNTKRHFDSLKYNLENQLILQTKEKFVGKKTVSQMSLKAAFETFEKRVRPEAKNHVFENEANKFLALFELSSSDEYETVGNLAQLLTGLKISDWADNTKELYFSRLEEIQETLISYIPEKVNGKSKPQESVNGYSISFENEKGKPVTKSFSKVQPSRRAQILENEIKRTIDEMGQSVTEAEKRQVLIDLLEWLC